MINFLSNPIQSNQSFLYPNNLKHKFKSWLLYKLSLYEPYICWLSWKQIYIETDRGKIEVTCGKYVVIFILFSVFSDTILLRPTQEVFQFLDKSIIVDNRLTKRKENKTSLIF